MYVALVHFIIVTCMAAANCKYTEQPPPNLTIKKSEVEGLPKPKINVLRSKNFKLYFYKTLEKYLFFIANICTKIKILHGQCQIK